ncbi:MAG: hypothetical protein L0Y50_10640 [Beijerinckiaceae bacterium]|nr:hypothetical protein [Beijerinckiaceae bacterium]MCI0736709.1 hypothetical protein [Beijerinckiaceae bacterium]
MRTGVILCIATAVTAAEILEAALAPAVQTGRRDQSFGTGYQAATRKIVFAEELYLEPYVLPFYDEQNYCWQQVWTPHGWRWVDVCHGYAF